MRIIPEATFDRGRSSIRRDEWAMVVVALAFAVEEDDERPPESVNIAKFPDRLIVVVVVSSDSSGDPSSFPLPSPSSFLIVFFLSFFFLLSVFVVVLVKKVSPKVSNRLRFPPAPSR